MGHAAALQPGQRVTPTAAQRSAANNSAPCVPMRPAAAATAVEPSPAHKLLADHHAMAWEDKPTQQDLGQSSGYTHPPIRRKHCLAARAEQTLARVIIKDRQQPAQEATTSCTTCRGACLPFVAGSTLKPPAVGLQVPARQARTCCPPYLSQRAVLPRINPETDSQNSTYAPHF